jgi:multiple sugar transport system permease protein
VRIAIPSVLRSIVKVIFLCFFFLPIAFMAINSFRPHWAIVSNSFAFAPTLQNYETLLGSGLEQYHYGVFLLNSSILAVGATVLGVALGLPAAFALSKLNLKGAGNLGVFFLSFRFLPITAVLIPLFVLWQQLNLADTYHGMILVYLVITIPYCVWMMQIYFNEVPDEIFQAAQIDGYSNPQILWKILIPACIPGLLVTIWIMFLFCWNEFFLALVLTRVATSTATVTPSYFLANLGQGYLWGELTAAGLLMSLPLFALIGFTQKYFIKALSFGLVK